MSQSEPEVFLCGAGCGAYLKPPSHTPRARVNGTQVCFSCFKSEGVEDVTPHTCRSDKLDDIKCDMAWFHNGEVLYVKED